LKGKAVDLRADQYFPGVMAYEMMCGRLPFDEEELNTLLFKHISEQPTPPKRHNPELPDWMQEMVLKMMAKNPEDRYADMDEVLAFIETHR
jgi:eukaryotic-like serine/threonine-protein kinase